jgi:hypothetical protein
VTQVELPDNPYPGLRAYGVGEELLFFGRERHVDAMVELLGRQRLLAVLGSSGSGKSSLVNCGLLPALRRGALVGEAVGFRVVHMRPGYNAIKSLARALSTPGVLFEPAGSVPLPELIEANLRLSGLGLCDLYEQAKLGTNLLVVVDQFEELFRYEGRTAARREDAAAFVNLLLDASQQRRLPIYVVLSMRSDFLGDCAKFPGLVERVNQSRYLVPRLTRDERRSVIRGPARVNGTDVDPVLVTQLVNDVGDDPNQLCLLQHVLQRTYVFWRKRGANGPLTLADYEQTGKMTHALDIHAEGLVLGLTREQRELTERVFRALSDTVKEPRGVRRPLTFAMLRSVTGKSTRALREVLDTFRDPDVCFLMPPKSEVVTDDTLVDISHERLMQLWKRLHAWVQREAEAAHLYLRLANDAALHAQRALSLMRDPQLSVTLQFWRSQQPGADWASLYAVNFEQSRRYLRQSVRGKRLRQAIVGVVVLALGGAGAAAFDSTRAAAAADADLDAQRAEVVSTQAALAQRKRELAEAEAAEAERQARTTAAQLQEVEAKARELERRRAAFFEKNPFLLPAIVEARETQRRLRWDVELAKETTVLLDVAVRGVRHQVVDIGRWGSQVNAVLEFLASALQTGAELETRATEERSRAAVTLLRAETGLVEEQRESNALAVELLKARALPFQTGQLSVPTLLGVESVGETPISQAIAFPVGTDCFVWFSTRGLAGWWYPSNDPKLLEPELARLREFAESYATERVVATTLSGSDRLDENSKTDGLAPEPMTYAGWIAALEERWLRAPKSPAEGEEAPWPCPVAEWTAQDSPLRRFDARPNQRASALEHERELLDMDLLTLNGRNEASEAELTRLRAVNAGLAELLDAAKRDRTLAIERLNALDARSLAHGQQVADAVIKLSGVGVETRFLYELAAAKGDELKGLDLNQEQMRAYLRERRVGQGSQKQSESH